MMVGLVEAKTNNKFDIGTYIYLLFIAAFFYGLVLPAFYYHYADIPEHNALRVYEGPISLSHVVRSGNLMRTDDYLFTCRNTTLGSNSCLPVDALKALEESKVPVKITWFEQHVNLFDTHNRVVSIEVNGNIILERETTIRRTDEGRLPAYAWAAGSFIIIAILSFRLFIKVGRYQQEHSTE